MDGPTKWKMKEAYKECLKFASWRELGYKSNQNPNKHLFKRYGKLPFFAWYDQFGDKET